MTRQFERKIRCPYCSSIIPAVEPFSRWMRSQPELDSVREQVVFSDIDIICHRYLAKSDRRGERNIELLMVVEYKTRLAEPTLSQRDTLHMFAQCLDNERRTPTKHSLRRPHKQIICPIHLFSFAKQRIVPVRLLGAHLLQMDGDDPDTSKVILWDRKPIDKQTLIELLKMERDPYMPQRYLDLRRHHAADDLQLTLFSNTD